MAISCNGPSAMEPADQAKQDSLKVADELAYKQKEESKSASSSPVLADEGIANDKAKMEKQEITTKGYSAKKAPVTMKENLAQLSDTIYLKNVRLSKKFIKTADFRFKVKNVEQVTHQLEKLALKLDGYVQQSQIKSNYVSGRTIELNPDTMLTVFEYYIDNQLIIRVPSIYFDSVLNEIAKVHVYLDSRDIKTKDVSTIFLRNKLKAEKNTEYEKRIQKASDQSNRRLDDIVEAERQASELADKAIDKKIENYELQDQIDFSTITMSIYQANSIYQEKVKNTRLYAYQPNFWQRAWEALKTGWDVILNVVIGLLYLWPLYIIAILVYFGIMYLRKKFKK
jgi:hypothetical protein